MKGIDAMSTLYASLGLAGGGVVSLVGAGGKTSLMFSLAREIAGLGATVLTTTTTKIMMPSREQSAHVILTTSVQTLLGKAEGLLKKSRHVTAAFPRESRHGEKISGFPPAFVEEVFSSGLFQWVIVEADGAAQRPLKAPADHEPVIPGASQWVIGVAGLTAVGKPLYPAWVFRHQRFAALTGLDEGMEVTSAAVAGILTHPLGTFKTCPPPARKLVFLNTRGDHRLVNTGREVAREIFAVKPASGILRVLVGSPLEGGTVVAGMTGGAGEEDE